MSVRKTAAVDVESTVKIWSCGLKLSVGLNSQVYLIEIEGPFTQESRPGRTFGESVGATLKMDNSDWSNGIRYHIFDTRSDTEFKHPN
jgi:hypothetical protein